MRHRVTENTKANRRIDMAHDLRPFLEIGECVTIGSLFLFVHDPIKTLL